jgi:hypothetical protein
LPPKLSSPGSTPSHLDDLNDESMDVAEFEDFRPPKLVATRRRSSRATQSTIITKRRQSMREGIKVEKSMSRRTSTASKTVKVPLKVETRGSIG